jgi:hypothetical protein
LFYFGADPAQKTEGSLCPDLGNYEYTFSGFGLLGGGAWFCLKANWNHIYPGNFIFDSAGNRNPDFDSVFSYNLQPGGQDKKPQSGVGPAQRKNFKNKQKR